MAKVTELSPTWLGRMVEIVTFGLIKPSVTLKGFDGRNGDRLVARDVNVTIDGNIYGKSNGSFAAVKNGDWSDPSVWKQL